MSVTVKKIYEAAEKQDGFRILVDRLWPRGVSKEKAGIDLWLKEIAPSTELREWFNHDPAKWKEFQKKYNKELKANDEAVSILKKHMREGKVTLLYSAKDETHNQAVALKEFIED